MEQRQTLNILGVIHVSPIVENLNAITDIRLEIPHLEEFEACGESQGQQESRLLRRQSCACL